MILKKAHPTMYLLWLNLENSIARYQIFLSNSKYSELFYIAESVGNQHLVEANHQGRFPA